MRRLEVLVLALAMCAWAPVIAEIDCGFPPATENTDSNYNTTTYMSEAYYTCLPGFMSPSSESLFICNQSGYWEGENINCTKIDCGPPPDISFATRDFSGTTDYLSVATYQCWSGFAHKYGYRFNLTCTATNGTGSWGDTIPNSCYRLSNYGGCFVADPVSVGTALDYDICLATCFEFNSSFAALRGAECGCLKAFPVDRAPDQNCSLQCQTENMVCGGDMDLWSVYATFEGCYSNIDREGSFHATNELTCQESCRGSDNIYAAHFGSGVCRCLNETQSEAVDENLKRCQQSNKNGSVRVYTLDLVPRAGDSCKDLFLLGVYQHGWYYLKNETNRVNCNFIDGTVCDFGWLGMLGTCYFWSWALNASSMETAHSYCVASDSLLLAINDEKEAASINYFLQSMPLLKNVYSSWRLGLYDHFQNFAPQWSDGSLLSYRGFRYDQPNNILFQCMELTGTEWVNGDCLYATGFVCERSKNVRGCVKMPRSEIAQVYVLKDSEKMTLTLCFETCRGRNLTYAAAVNDTCYCFSQLPPSSVDLPWANCSTRCPGNRYQLCGLGKPSNVSEVVAFIIKDVGQPAAKSCLDLQLQGITGSLFKVEQAGVVSIKNCTTQGLTCPVSWAFSNGRCYKYFVQTSVYPVTLCGNAFGAYLSVIDSLQEKEAHFGRNNTITWSGDRIWTVGLFDHGPTGFIRTTNGRAVKGLPAIRSVGVSSAGECLAYNINGDAFISTACNALPFICEKGPEYVGCARLTASDVLVLNNFAEMSVTQCVELCRARGDTYALLGNNPFRCYCSRQQPYVAGDLCNSYCFPELAQLCGGQYSVSAYVVDEFPAFATSCEDLFAEALLVPGTYLVHGQVTWCSMKDNSSCSVYNPSNWLDVGVGGACFHLSLSEFAPAQAPATCKLQQPSLVLASIRSSNEQTFLTTLYSMLKRAYLKYPFHIGASDQLEVGCFTWADGWLFSSAPWQTSYPMLNYGQSNSIDKNTYTVFTNDGSFANANLSSKSGKVLCREVNDFHGCFLKPSNFHAAVEDYSSMSLTLCRQVCLGNAAAFAAVETKSCYCLTHQDVSALENGPQNATGCDVPCPSNGLQSCAETGYIRVYSVNDTDVATDCTTLYANFIVLNMTYLLRNKTTGVKEFTTCGLSDSTTCPLGYIGYGAKCFRFFPATYKTTQMAADHCVSVGGYLATPRSPDEVEFLTSVLSGIPSLSDITQWRLGVVDVMNGHYFASSDGSLMALSEMWNQTMEEKRGGGCSSLLTSSKSVQRSECNAMLPYICETGTEFFGCHHLVPDPDSFRVNLRAMSVQQCVTLCDALDIRYAALTSSVCVCVSDDKINSTSYVGVQCATRCTESFSQNCGSYNAEDIFAVYDTGMYSLEEKTGASCLTLRQFAVTAVGQYYLKAQNGSRFKATCNDGGLRFKDILKIEADLALYSASTNGIFSKDSRLDIESVKWSSWMPAVTDSAPWVQVVMSDYYLIKAVSISGSSAQGSGDYVTKFQLYHGLDSDNLNKYSEIFSGIESGISTDLAVRFLLQPVVAKLIRLSHFEWPQLAYPALVFTLLGELYGDVNHSETYIGCVADPLKSLFSSQTAVTTVEDCKNHCITQGKPMFGLFQSDSDANCACASEVGAFGMLQDHMCSFNCCGSWACGNDDALSVAVHRTYENKCPSPPVVENAVRTVSYLVYSPGVSTFGMNVTYTCNDGYEFPDLNRSITITCQQNNEWSQQPENCQIVSCPPPQNITNALVEYSDLVYGATATYACDKAHSMLDGAVRAVSTCSSDKTWKPVYQCLRLKPIRGSYACISGRGQQITSGSLREIRTRSRLECTALCMVLVECIFYSYSQHITPGTVNCKIHCDNSSIATYLNWNIYALHQTSCG